MDIGATASTWSCAVFAYNEARTITACLDSLEAAAGGLRRPVSIYVLANGCTDDTASIVDRYSLNHGHVKCIRLHMADKAAAWNHYIHHLASEVDMHLFIDGDVRACVGSAESLAQRLSDDPKARAVAAQPASGRSRTAWSANMIRFGRVAGCLYALRGEFVSELRTGDFVIPEGLVGEDLFLSAVIKGNLSPGGLFQPDSKLAIEPTAQFEFRSLSYRRPADWALYGRRLVRYRICDYQLMLLLNYLQWHGSDALPENMRELYATTAVKPPFRWHGRRTPLEWLAVAILRAQIESARRQREGVGY